MKLNKYHAIVNLSEAIQALTSSEWEFNSNPSQDMLRAIECIDKAYDLLTKKDEN